MEQLCQVAQAQLQVVQTPNEHTQCESVFQVEKVFAGSNDRFDGEILAGVSKVRMEPIQVIIDDFFK